MYKLEDLCVDPEFKNKIPPLTDDEFNQLRENILKDRIVRDPIVVWNGIILDGHHRFRIIQENPHIKFRVQEMNFPDRWKAIEWIYKNQLGRRNLTDEQRTVLIGKMYEARKHSHGASDGFRGNQSVSTQNGNLANPQRISDQIAQELGVAKNTVIRAEQFTKGIDKLKEVSEEAADKILAGRSGVTKKAVMELSKMEPEKVKEFAESVVDGTQKSSSEPQPKKPARLGSRVGRPKEYRELREDLDAIERDMYSEPPEFTIENLLTEISATGAEWSRMLVMSVNSRPELLTDENRKLIGNEINKICNEFKKVRNMIYAEKS